MIALYYVGNLISVVRKWIGYIILIHAALIVCDIYIIIAPPSQPTIPAITLTTTHIFQMTFMVEEGSYPITAFLLNITRLGSSGTSSTTQIRIDVTDLLYVDSFVELGEGEKKVVLVVPDLQQLHHYTFQVAAESAVGVGEFSEPSNPTTLGQWYL